MSQKTFHGDWMSSFENRDWVNHPSKTPLFWGGGDLLSGP